MKKYEKNKVSNTELVKEIPEFWISSKLKYVLKTMKSGGTPDSNNSDYYSSDGIPWVSIGDMSNVDFVFDTAKHLSKEGILSKNLTIYPKGTILYSIYATLGKVSELASPACINQAILALCPNDRIEKQFLKYSLKSQEDFVRSFSSSNTQSNLNADKVSNMPVFLPPIGEQKKISSFLDYKTGKIDSLVTLLFDRIENLKKYRQAVISETVTHGLDKYAKMKDSGVDWIGEIPEKWILVPLKYLINGGMKYGANESAESDNKNWPRYIRITDITNKGDLRDDSFKSLSPEKANDYMLSYGDILFARSGATVGKTYLFKENYPACYAGYLIKVTCGERILPEFLIRYTQSHSYDNWKDSVYIMSTIQNIGADKYSNLPVPVPAIEEQQSIIDYLDRKTKQIDECIAATEQRIDDLQKYRSSLIYEAVTGQIDVRDWTPNKEKNSI